MQGRSGGDDAFGKLLAGHRFVGPAGAFACENPAILELASQGGMFFFLKRRDCGYEQLWVR